VQPNHMPRREGRTHQEQPGDRAAPSIQGRQCQRLLLEPPKDEVDRAQLAVGLAGDRGLTARGLEHEVDDASSRRNGHLRSRPPARRVQPPDQRLEHRGLEVIANSGRRRWEEADAHVGAEGEAEREERFEADAIDPAKQP
jgi:hypothetical protein